LFLQPLRLGGLLFPLPLGQILLVLFLPFLFLLLDALLFLLKLLQPLRFSLFLFLSQGFSLRAALLLTFNLLFFFGELSCTLLERFKLSLLGLFFLLPLFQSDLFNVSLRPVLPSDFSLRSIRIVRLCTL